MFQQTCADQISEYNVVLSCNNLLCNLVLLYIPVMQDKLYQQIYHHTINCLWKISNVSMHPTQEMKTLILT